MILFPMNVVEARQALDLARSSRQPRSATLDAELRTRKHILDNLDDSDTIWVSPPDPIMRGWPVDQARTYLERHGLISTGESER